LLANGRQIGIKLAQGLVTNPANKFAVTLCTQTLLAKHKLIADTDGTGFVTNL